MGALPYNMTWRTAFEWPSQCWLPIVNEEDSLSWSGSSLLEGPCSIPWLPEQRHCMLVQVCAERAASVRLFCRIDQLCALLIVSQEDVFSRPCRMVLRNLIKKK